VDLYELLEISPHASQEVIHAAYRTLARSYHPDLNRSADAAKHIQRLNAAYAVLGDPGTRARYDLERKRAHRRPVLEDSAVVADAPTPAPRSLEPRVARARVEATGRPIEMHLHRLSSHALLALIFITALASIVLVLVWVTAEAAPEDAVYLPAISALIGQ
jgi:curved DNA-binding protein CbpA